jgi:16S rRNA G527 N7-methylase RsmG
MLDSLNCNTNVEIIDKTYEDVELGRQFDLITLRLVKLTNRLLLKILSNLKKNGVFLYYSDNNIENIENKCSSINHSYTTTPNFPDKFFCVIRKK